MPDLFTRPPRAAADCFQNTVLPFESGDGRLGQHLDICPHTATAFDKGKVGNCDTGPLDKGEAKAITFSRPGTYFYICTPHPWMYGQVIVE